MLPMNRTGFNWRARVYRSTTSRVAESSMARPMSRKAPAAWEASVRRSRATIQMERFRLGKAPGTPDLMLSAPPGDLTGWGRPDYKGPANDRTSTNRSCDGRRATAARAREDDDEAHLGGRAVFRRGIPLRHP